MRNGAAVTVRGADELAASFQTLAGDLDDLDTAGGRAGTLVQVNAKRRAPKQSGALAATIKVDVDAHGQSVTVTAGTGRVVYAGVQEGGWPARHIRANWYMRNALRDTADKVTDLYAADVTNKTDKVKGA